MGAAHPAGQGGDPRVDRGRGAVATVAAVAAAGRGPRRGMSQGFKTARNLIRVSRCRFRARTVLGCGGALPVFALAIGMSCSSLKHVLSYSKDRLKAR